MEILKVRPGEERDHEAAMSVWRRSAERAEEPLSERYGERLRRHMAVPDAALIVAEYEDELVGMAVGIQAYDSERDCSIVPGLCHVSAVFVVPEWWGRGLGKLLIDAILDSARARGYGRIQLWTHVSNARARRLYEGRGFVASGLREDEGVDEILHYERLL